jgi:hypothetical protein
VIALRRFSVAALVALVALGGFAGGARGAPEGVIITASATGWSVIYHDPDSPIPANPAAEFHIAYSLASLDTGPAGYGLSSILWPGSAAANFGDVYDLPTYPVRAEAFYPKGPERDQNEMGPGTTMQARATEVLTEAETTSMHRADAPGSQAGLLRSSVRSTIEDGVATTQATAKVKDLQLLDGLIEIGSVLTEATITSDGKNPEILGKTKLAAVTVAGQKATIDEKGIHAGGQTIEVPNVFGEGAVRDALAAAGITVKLARPIEKMRRGSATTEIGGLVVRFDGTAFKKLLDPLPEEVKDEINRQFDFRKEVVYRFGAVSLGVGANEGALQLPKLPPELPDPPAPDIAPLPDLGGTVPLPEFGGEPPEISAPPPAGEPMPTAAETSLPTGHPLPAVIVGLALVGALAGTGGLRKMADLLVMGEGASCPHKES